MKTKNCQPCHLELSAKLDVIERMPGEYAAYALAVSSACDSIQLGARTTLKALNALADISNSGDFRQVGLSIVRTTFSRLLLRQR